MIYPINIFTPDPVTKSVRPFMIFVAFKVEFNVMKSLAYGSTIDILAPEGGFVLPMPNGGLIDSSQNQYGEEPSGLGKLAQSAGGAVDSLIQNIPMLGSIDNSMARMGMLPDPRMTQIYNGTSSRSYSGTWQIIPQSAGESASAAAILWFVKFSASPDRMGNDKVGILLAPHIYKIIFSNPVIQMAMQYDKMAIESYEINYFAQGYASTYSDMMPKHISLTLNFKEFGIKTKKEWSSM